MDERRGIGAFGGLRLEQPMDTDIIRVSGCGVVPALKEKMAFRLIEDIELMAGCVGCLLQGVGQGHQRLLHHLAKTGRFQWRDCLQV